ncbi:MAG: NUDIX domain-containing protein [Rhizomicrobium sp.]
MPKILDIRTVYKGWATVSIATIRGANGQVFERLMEDHGRGVCVLPYDPDRKLATLVRQFRAPVCATVAQVNLIEAVAGLIDNEGGACAVLREAFEETGLRLRNLDHVATVWTMPGISTERMDMFLATYSESDRVGSGGGEAGEHEDITVEEMPLAALAKAADEGRLEDMKALALVQTLRLREPRLFR